MHYEKKNANLATFFLYCLHFNVSLHKNYLKDAVLPYGVGRIEYATNH